MPTPVRFIILYSLSAVTGGPGWLWAGMRVVQGCECD